MTYKYIRVYEFLAGSKHAILDAQFYTLRLNDRLGLYYSIFYVDASGNSITQSV